MSSELKDPADNEVTAQLVALARSNSAPNTRG